MRPPDHMLSKGTPDSWLSVLLKIQMYPLSMHIYGAGGRCKRGSLRKQTNRKIEMGFYLFCPGCPQIPVTMCSPLKQNAGQHLPRPL